MKYPIVIQGFDKLEKQDNKTQ